MNTSDLYYRIEGWVQSVLNPPSILNPEKVNIHMSDDDFSVGEKSFIVIGYTPTIVSTAENGGNRLAVSEKSTNGLFETGDVVNNLSNFHKISDGELSISIDGEAAVLISGLDFTEALSMSSVAEVLQTEISGVIGPNLIKVEYTRGLKDFFQFISVTSGSGSSVVISSTGTGTDLTNEYYLNGGVSVIGIDDTDTEQTYLTPYSAKVEIRQVYGNGEYLQKLVNSLWLTSTINYFKKNKFSIIEKGDIQSIPFQNGHKTIKESIITFTFTFFGVSKEDIGYIENITFNGTLENENDSESHEISNGG